jgi:hypothetical protein
MFRAATFRVSDVLSRLEWSKLRAGRIYRNVACDTKRHISHNRIMICSYFKQVVELLNLNSIF